MEIPPSFIARGKITNSNEWKGRNGDKGLHTEIAITLWSLSCCDVYTFLFNSSLGQIEDGNVFLRGSILTTDFMEKQQFP